MDQFDHCLEKKETLFVNYEDIICIANLRRCRKIVERSRVFRELGNITGSVMRISVIGSKYSSGASS